MICFFSFPYHVAIYILAIVLLPLIKNTWTHGTVCHLELDKCLVCKIDHEIMGYLHMTFVMVAVVWGKGHEDQQHVHSILGFCEWPYRITSQVAWMMLFAI